MSNFDKSSLRKIVKVLLEDKTLGPAMVKVNPVVDPSAAVTNPENQDFKPQNSIELKIALSALADQIPDDSAHKIGRAHV